MKTEKKDEIPTPYPEITVIIYKIPFFPKTTNLSHMSNIKMSVKTFIINFGPWEREGKREEE